MTVDDAIVAHVCRSSIVILMPIMIPIQVSFQIYCIVHCRVVMMAHF